MISSIGFRSNEILSTSLGSLRNFITSGSKVSQAAKVIGIVAGVILAAYCLIRFVRSYRDINSPRNIEAHNRITLEKIQKLAQEGKSLGCFLCRWECQSLPIEENRIWISLDKGDLQKRPDKNRLHLVMDLENEQQMQKLQGLFDKVILDVNSLKFFKKPFRNFGLLLKDHQDSELVIEARVDWFGSDFRLPSSVNVENGDYVINSKDFPKDRGSIYPFWKANLYPQLEAHLKTLFQEVVYHEKEPWPCESYKNNFFTLRGPKVKELKGQNSI